MSTLSRTLEGGLVAFLDAIEDRHGAVAALFVLFNGLFLLAALLVTPVLLFGRTGAIILAVGGVVCGYTIFLYLVLSGIRMVKKERMLDETDRN